MAQVLGEHSGSDRQSGLAHLAGNSHTFSYLQVFSVSAKSCMAKSLLRILNPGRPLTFHC